MVNFTSNFRDLYEHLPQLGTARLWRECQSLVCRAETTGDMQFSNIYCSRTTLLFLFPRKSRWKKWSKKWKWESDSNYTETPATLKVSTLLDFQQPKLAFALEKGEGKTEEGSRNSTSPNLNVSKMAEKHRKWKTEGQQLLTTMGRTATTYSLGILPSICVSLQFRAHLSAGKSKPESWKCQVSPLIT